MKRLVATVYANILKFLIAALEWYDEGKIAYAIHAITRPAALRYDDVLQEIETKQFFPGCTAGHIVLGVLNNSITSST